MNEVMIQPRVNHQAGIVVFDNYDEILREAQELAEYVSNVVVTDESVKATKKMLAEVNKKVNELEDGRKTIKKELLAPYEAFEKQIKSITSIVKEADNTVRSQVRELEEKERQSKQEEITNLFVKRLKLYPMIDNVFFPFDFIKASHLNKSTTISKVEAEMVQWFEQKKKDIEYIESKPHWYDIMVEYVKTQDVIQAIQRVEAREKSKEALLNKKETVINNSVIIVIDENDLKTVEAFMKSLNINYTTKRGN
jgi:hypothetical protein